MAHPRTTFIATAAIAAVVGAAAGGGAVAMLGARQAAEHAEVTRHMSARLNELQTAADAQKADGTAFGAAIRRELEHGGQLCLPPFKWPVDVDPRGFDMGLRGQMAALERAGLVAGAPATVEAKDFFGRPAGTAPVTRFTVTEAGRKYLRVIEPGTVFLLGQHGNEAFCYGRKVLDKILDWQGPMTMGSYAEAKILYTYAVEDPAPWASDAAIREAFPEMAQRLAPPGGMRDQILLHKTANGWSARGLGG